MFCSASKRLVMILGQNKCWNSDDPFVCKLHASIHKSEIALTFEAPTRYFLSAQVMWMIEEIAIKMYIIIIANLSKIRTGDIK